MFVNKECGAGAGMQISYKISNSLWADQADVLFAINKLKYTKEMRNKMEYKPIVLQPLYYYSCKQHSDSYI